MNKNKKGMINCLGWVLFTAIFFFNSWAQGHARTLSEMVFIDPSVPEVEKIEAQLPENAEVVRLSHGMDGIMQISSMLEKKKDLLTIRIISHGNEGYFVLNGKRIDKNSLQDHGSSIANWGRALAENGDILLYACNLAATNEGKAFVEKLADFTGADIAASADITGGDFYNGNWNLEYEIGQIDTAGLTIEPDIDIKLAAVSWNGAADAVWNNVGNWVGGDRADSTDDTITIQAAGTSPNLDVSTTFTSWTIAGTVNIVAGGEIKASGDIINNGTVSAGDGVAIVITSTGGTVDLNGAITSGTSTITIDSDNTSGIDLTGASTITSTSGTITFNDIIDGANTLNVNAGTGVIDFQGIIGGATPPTTLTITQSGGTTFQGNVSTATSVVLTDTTDAANITFNGALTTPTLTTAGEAYDVDLFGGCSITSDTNFINTGTTVIGNGSGDSSTFTGGLDATAGAVSIAGTVATTNTAMDLGATTQTADSTIKSGSGAITVASMTGDYNLTLQSDIAGATGGVTFSGNLAANDLIIFGRGYAVTLLGSTNVIDSDTSFLNTGTTSIGNGSGDSSTFTGGLDATAGDVSIGGTVATTNQNIDFGATTLNSNTTLNSGGGAIAMTTLAGGSKDLIIHAATGVGTTTISGAVTALGDGTGAALTVQNGLTGLVTFQSTVAGNSGISATGGAQTMRFNDDVTLADGDTGTTIVTTQLDGLIWSNYDGASFGATTVSGNSTINSNAGTIIFGAVTINNGTILTGGTGDTGAISFGSTVDSEAGGTGNLTINTDDTATLSGHIGNTTQLGTITLTSGNFATSGKNISASGLTVSTGTFNSASAAGTWDINGNLSIAGGTLKATSGNFKVSGNWSNSATFAANNGTVTLDGSGQALTGDTSFYNLTKNVTSADTLTLQSGSANKTIITNTLNLSGASGQLLSLRSSSAGTQWEIDPQTTRTISYLDVKDANNVNVETAV